jgi:hypothetical protein
MNTNVDLVPDPSAFMHRAPYGVQPAVKVLSDGEIIAIKDESLVPIGDSFGQLTGYFFASLAVDVPTLPTNFVLTYPPSIFAAVDAPLSPTSSSRSHNNLRKLC